MFVTENQFWFIAQEWHILKKKTDLIMLPVSLNFYLILRLVLFFSII